MSKFEVLQSNKIQTEQDKLDQTFIPREHLNYSVHNLVTIGDSTSKLITDCIRITIIAIMVMPLLSLSFTLGEFIALITIIGVLDRISHSISFRYMQLTKSYIHIDKLLDFIETTPSISGFYEGKEFTYNQGAISVENISFIYKDGEQVFHDFSLDILPQKKTALVGISGSGKSTLVKLIAGYLQPTQGRICVDGQALNTVSLSSYYTHIGYLTQEPSIFDGTVRDNLLYGISDSPSEHELHNILKLAKCDFIFDFADGIDTEIGEKGIRLSGGQRQRLAIAKVFIKDPKIIILDEPTSALDSFSEEGITQAMHNLFEGRTVIIIAHRLQTVKEADDIIVIEQGSIVERGTHKELVANNQTYATMLRLQSGF